MGQFEGTREADLNLLDPRTIQALERPRNSLLSALLQLVQIPQQGEMFKSNLQ